jgi:redox-sensitive bicupin YhaK (pirin superfamily)
VRGRIEVNGHALVEGDAAMLTAETGIDLGAGRNAEVLVFDLAP